MSRVITLVLFVACMAAVWAADLPITDVTLFTSGVGYVQRAGTVQDTATVQLSFKPEQINDLLKSMVLLDLDGGKVGAVTYGAKDPIGKTLQAFAVNITDNPTLAQLLNRLRGVSAEVVATTTVTGKILGVETQKKAVKDTVIEVQVLNLLTDTGLRAVHLDEITSLRLLDDKLNKELQDALAVIAAGLDNQRKPVMITFAGTGARKVIVGYLTETPLWKTSYRLVLGEKRNLLQGWAIVENTSDADWTNVRLSLVSGRPISFIQDLYTPLYIPRPVVQPELYASLRPVMYGADLDGANDTDDRLAAGKADSAGRMRAHAGIPRPQPPPPASAPAQGWNAETDGSELSYIRDSVTSAAAAKDLGQAFEYAIKDPVTLPRQQSALLPIVTGPVDVWQVSVYNAGVQAKFPLYGLRVKNTTGLHLMGGPITIYNGDTYAGDATFEDLQPDEQRLVTYAIDLGVQSACTEKPGIEEVLAAKLVKGTLVVTLKSRHTVEYTFAVKDGKNRKLLVEHPFIEGWDLAEPKQADERTDTLYRFTVPMKAAESTTLKVVEEHVDLQYMRVANMDSAALVGYIQTGKISQPVREALQRVANRQNALRNTQRQRAQNEQEIRTISAEQDRLRKNMNALSQGSDLYKRYVAKLGVQETRIEKLRAANLDLQEKENSQRRELEEYIAGLNLE